MMTRSTATILSKIFLGALLIRWIYALAVYAAMGEPGIKGVDSYTYSNDAREFADAILAGTVHGWDWLGPRLATMPLFAWLITLLAIMFGSHADLAFVLTQGVLDSATCLLVYGMARSLDERYALPAAIAAALNPTQVVLSGLVYTDTLFVLLVTVFLFASMQWLRSATLGWAVLIGIGLGGAALVRVLIVPWAVVLVVLLLIVELFRRRLSLRTAGHLAAILAIVGICIAPVMWRNMSAYGTWALTPQSGLHLARWVAPLVREAQDGTPWPKGEVEMETRMRERFGPPAENPFEESSRYTEIGREELTRLGTWSIVKAWVFGATINLAAPAVTLSPPISQLPRTGFYGTIGSTLVEKVFNFLFRSDSAMYAWALLVGIAGVGLFRVLQLAGLAAVLRQREHWPVALLFAAWFVFILVVNGPIASPKYRLPLEPLLAVLSGAGLRALKQRAKRPA